MEKFGKSQSVLRTEDNRFLTGTGRYIDDSTPAASLFAYFFRSQVAHAKIVNLNVDDAQKSSGVYGVFTAEDLEKNRIKNALKPSVRFKYKIELSNISHSYNKSNIFDIFKNKNITINKGDKYLIKGKPIDKKALFIFPSAP